MLGWWQVVAADGLKDRAGNQQTVQAEKLIDRGRILTADGTVLASSRARRVNGQHVFERVYPQGTLAAHVVGYTSDDKGKTGIETTYNRYLAGQLRHRAAAAAPEPEGEAGRRRPAELDTRVQKVAEEELAGRRGAVVAIDPRTGQVHRDGLVADLRTCRRSLTDFGSILAAGLAAAQPRRPGPLRPRLDL